MDKIQIVHNKSNNRVEVLTMVDNGKDIVSFYQLTIDHEKQEYVFQQPTMQIGSIVLYKNSNQIGVGCQRPSR